MPWSCDGAPVDRVPDGLAVVFQDYSRSLLPWLSVQDNVGLPLRRKSSAGPAGRRVPSGGRWPRGRWRPSAWPVPRTRYPWQLSGGMQQRVAIARALACDPVLLLMDEPFGSVDAQTREDLEDLILAVRRERDITILLVTHDIDESVYVGDRVVVLTRGPGGSAPSCPWTCPHRAIRSAPANSRPSCTCGHPWAAWSAGRSLRPAWPAKRPAAEHGPIGRGRDHALPRARLACRNAVSRSSGQVLITSSGPSQPRCAVPIP